MSERSISGSATLSEQQWITTDGMDYASNPYSTRAPQNPIIPVLAIGNVQIPLTADKRDGTYRALRQACEGGTASFTGTRRWSTLIPYTPGANVVYDGELTDGKNSFRIQVDLHQPTERNTVISRTS